ncbi:hypothetical protein M3795_16810 [Ralstonia pickettii]|jgi:hypothetical protein|uniref:Uncharacterized protein n=1 Tax=Ralstonia pickettii OR214 TaxID=1264675 RepID=R0EE61_RALPI|nr:hypothetical protein [Ralstonia pickettii]ENZ79612.1 hypothetical protein OR214_00028 [Ralstonia pickettii OR214]MCM3582146.1 hypothetical protein [Ralstonia pickettii]
MKAKPLNTASIAPNLFCNSCGWPIIHACCNDEMSNEPWGTDYWGYCSNKGCVNHDGQAWDQDGLDFAFSPEAQRDAE